MPRSKARIIEVFGKTLIIKKNPWYHPKMKDILLSIGKRPKKPEEILTTPPPWFMNPAEMPEGVYARARLFSEVSSATGGMRLRQRIKIIKERLSTGRKPRPSRAKPAGQRFHEQYPTYEALRAKAPAIAVAPVIRE